MSIFKIGLLSASLLIAIHNGSIANNDRDSFEDGSIGGIRSPQYSVREGGEFNNTGEGGIVIIGRQAPFVFQLPGVHQPKLLLDRLSFDLAALFDEAPGSVRIKGDDMIVHRTGVIPYSLPFFE